MKAKKKTLDTLKANKINNTNAIKGGTWFEDDEEFVKQTDSIKGR